jgi:AcrR family transcriptional regulator
VGVSGFRDLEGHEGAQSTLMGNGGLSTIDDGDQRKRLIDAFTRVAADRGYLSVTIEEITASAGLTTAVFDEHFPSTQHCLVAAYDSFFDRMFAEMRAACVADDVWSHRARDAVGAIFEFVGETASRARMFAIEATSAGGPQLLERRFALIARLAEMLREGRRHHPAAAAELPDCTETVLVAGAFAAIAARLLADDLKGLAELEAEVAEMVLAPFVGTAEAKSLASAGPPAGPAGS